VLGAIALGHRASDDANTKGSAYSRKRISAEELVRRGHW
jgi:hypothetical protein